MPPGSKLYAPWATPREDRRLVTPAEYLLRPVLSLLARDHCYTGVLWCCGLMGISATGLLVVMMLPVYIAMICALLIALLESLGACQRWRRGEVVVSRAFH